MNEIDEEIKELDSALKIVSEKRLKKRIPHSVKPVFQFSSLEFGEYTLYQVFERFQDVSFFTVSYGRKSSETDEIFILVERVYRYKGIAEDILKIIDENKEKLDEIEKTLSDFSISKEADFYQKITLRNYHFEAAPRIVDSPEKLKSEVDNATTDEEKNKLQKTLVLSEILSIVKEIINDYTKGFEY